MADLEAYQQAFGRLIQIMATLRTQCPWDRAQTLSSLRHLTIEETYELSQAVLDNDLVEVKQELGDLLLHIVFYAKIAAETQAFDIKDVIDGVCEKLIARHPHVFGDAVATDAQQVKHNWEVLKLKQQSADKSLLAGVPQSLPSLIKALRIQEKAHGVGFDWPHRQAVWAQVEAELLELKQCQTEADLEAEFGDVLFSLVNYARFLDLNPETALEKTNQKFIRRFHYIEKAARRDGKQLPNMSLTEMDAYWEEAKTLERTS
ncbi:MAG: nucleoside triphosphate pyrophosphohydrolase [Pseudomonadota bacterium]|nr:nucleoside triphosphate pyrophosphohydrolase [Pseudomonadota bacterium]